MVHSQNITTCLAFFKQLIQLTITLINSFWVACFSEIFGLLLSADRMFVTAVMSYSKALWPRWLSMVSPHCSAMLCLMLSLPSLSYFPFCLTEAPKVCVHVYHVQNTKFTHTSHYSLHQHSLRSNSQHFSQHTPCQEFCLNLLISSYGKHCKSPSSTSGSSLYNQMALLDSQTTMCETSYT